MNGFELSAGSQVSSHGTVSQTRVGLGLSVKRERQRAIVVISFFV